MSHEPLPPLSPGSVSLGLHRHELGDPSAEIDVMFREAVLAEEAGFDGVTLSEHHFDLPGYFPNPIACAAAILERTARVWAGPLPTVLPLRPAALVVEDLAWLAAAHPGRVVAGFAAGNAPREHALVGLEGNIVGPFTDGLRVVSESLIGSGSSPVADDSAVRAHHGRIPMVSAVKSGTAVRRAATLGFGVLLSGRDTDEDLRRFIDRYVDAGGTGPRAIVERVWAGAVPRPEQRTPANPKSIQQWDDATAGSAAEVVDRLSHLLTFVDSLNLRIHTTGFPPAAIEEQIGRLGAEVLPALRATSSAAAT